MTDALNFFQSMFMFKSFAPSGASRQEVRLAVWLKREAQNLATVADEEMRSGKTAQNLALTSTDIEKVRVFTEIALWHHNRAAEKYRRSAARFAEAATIKTGKSRKFRVSAIEMAHRTANAEAAVNLLNDLLIR